MYDTQEIQNHYREVTANSERPHQQAVAPDFSGYFKKAFEEIDNLFMQEVADGKQAR
jgi:hypothetical protein